MTLRGALAPSDSVPNAFRLQVAVHQADRVLEWWIPRTKLELAVLVKSKRERERRKEAKLDYKKQIMIWLFFQLI